MAVSRSPRGHCSAPRQDRGPVDLRAAEAADQRRPREAGRHEQRVDPPAHRHPRAAHRRARRRDVRPGEGSRRSARCARPASRRTRSASSSSARRRRTRSSRAPRACCSTRSARINAWGFDLGAACSGFTYALTTGMQMVATGAHDHALVVGADVMSSIIDYKDRTTCVLFGDGAGAVVLSPAAEDEPAIIGFCARDRRQRRSGAVHAGRRQPDAGVARDGRPAAALREAGRPGGVQVRGAQDGGDRAAAARQARHRRLGDRPVRLAPGQPPDHHGRGRAARACRIEGDHQPRDVRQHHRRDDPAGAGRRRRAGTAEEGRPGAARLGRRRVHRRRGACCAGVL